jgi:hypothetical protein
VERKQENPRGLDVGNDIPSHRLRDPWGLCPVGPRWRTGGPTLVWLEIAVERPAGDLPVAKPRKHANSLDCMFPLLPVSVGKAQALGGRNNLRVTVV